MSKSLNLFPSTQLLQTWFLLICNTMGKEGRGLFCGGWTVQIRIVRDMISHRIEGMREQYQREEDTTYSESPRKNIDPSRFGLKHFAFPLIDSDYVVCAASFSHEFPSDQQENTATHFQDAQATQFIRRRSRLRLFSLTLSIIISSRH
jgi:hypothetical protein